MIFRPLRVAIGRVSSAFVTWTLAMASMTVVIAVAVVAPAGQDRVASADPTPGCVIDTTGMIGWWEGEDDLAARVGPALVGTVGHADAVVRRGMSFDAGSRVGATALPTVTDGVTVEMWVRPGAIGELGRTQTLAGRWDAPGVDDTSRSYLLTIGPDAKLVWSTDEVTLRRPVDVVATVPQLFDGGFHHVAATWTPALVVIFVDGVQVASVASQGGVLNPAATTPFRLGSKDGLGDPFSFEGIIDEAAVFGRALSGAEIAAIHGAGAAGKCAPAPSEAVVTAADAVAGDAFGYTVAVDGGTTVIGAASSGGTGGGAAGSGSAYVFTGSGPTWSQQSELVAQDADAFDAFGDSVAIDANTIVVGAPGDDAAGSDAGAAYVFVRTGGAAGTWTLQTKLAAFDAQPNDAFGSSVSVDGNTIVVGAIGEGGDFSGAAYVFVRSGTTWTQQAKLRASDAAPIDLFGRSVAVRANTLAVGSPNDSHAVNFAGSAYVFTRTGTTWTQRAKVVAPDAVVGDFFGWSVSLTTGSLLATAYAADDTRGTAYVFRGANAAWTLEAELQAADGLAGDLFGISGSIDGDTVVLGAPWSATNGEQSGAAYVFRRTGTSWTQRVKLTADAASASVGDTFGSAVSISGYVVAVGVPGSDTAALDAGSVHLFTNP
jgi:hypothetical protein